MCKSKTQSLWFYAGWQLKPLKSPITTQHNTTLLIFASTLFFLSTFVSHIIELLRCQLQVFLSFHALLAINQNKLFFSLFFFWVLIYNVTRIVGLECSFQSNAYKLRLDFREVISVFGFCFVCLFGICLRFRCLPWKKC